MRGHGLMQAIARVNRVFRDKPGGLVVDYLGLAHELKQALATYTEAGGTGRAAFDQDEAVAAMIEKYEICIGLFHGFDWSKWLTGTAADRLTLLPAAQEHILTQEDGKDRLLRAVQDLTRAFALAVPHEQAMRIRDDVGFFQTVRGALAKPAPSQERAQEALDLAVRQIVSRAVASEGVMDVFAAAGLIRWAHSGLRRAFMVKHVSAREARAGFAELTDRVRYSGESVIVEKQGQPFAAVVSLDDFALLERVRRDERAARFSRLAAEATGEASGPEPNEEEIVAAVKRTREELHRERYGAA
jgi:prevent-host-death family protein